MMGKHVEYFLTGIVCYSFGVLIGWLEWGVRLQNARDRIEELKKENRSLKEWLFDESELYRKLSQTLGGGKC